MLDFGSGLGTAVWFVVSHFNACKELTSRTISLRITIRLLIDITFRAANEVFKGSIKEYICVDTSPAMIELSEKLLTGLRFVVFIHQYHAMLFADPNGKGAVISGVHHRQFMPASSVR